MQRGLNMMYGRRTWFLLVLLIALQVAGYRGLYADEFPGKEIFQRMVGTWTSEGKLTASESGDVIEVSEKWTGKFTEEGSRFVITGNRVWNGEDQTFKWEYYYNVGRGVVEVIYTATALDKELTMEVSVNEVEGNLTLLAPMGNDGGEIQIEKKFEKGKLISAVSVKGGNGQEVLQGRLEHKREEEKSQ